MISRATQNQLKEAIAIARLGEFVRYEVDVISARNTVANIDFSLKPIKDETGKVVLLITEGRDITELKLTQLALKQAQESVRLRDRALAASNNGIVIADVTMPNSPVIYANPAFERITGYSAAEMIGKNCRVLQGADTNQSGLKKLRAAIAQAKSCTVVLRN